MDWYDFQNLAFDLVLSTAVYVLSSKPLCAVTLSVSIVLQKVFLRLEFSGFPSEMYLYVGKSITAERLLLVTIEFYHYHSAAYTMMMLFQHFQ